TESIVQYQENNSWVIRSDDSKIQLLGQQISGPESYDQMTLSLQDGDNFEMVPVAQIQAYPDRVEAKFYPESLDRNVIPSIRIAQCSVQIYRQNTQIQCDPMNIQTSMFSAFIDQFNIFTNSDGISTSIQIALTDSNSLGNLTWVAQPGQTTSIE